MASSRTKRGTGDETTNFLYDDDNNGSSDEGGDKVEGDDYDYASESDADSEGVGSGYDSYDEQDGAKYNGSSRVGQKKGSEERYKWTKMVYAFHSTFTYGDFQQTQTQTQSHKPSDVSSLRSGRTSREPSRSRKVKKQVAFSFTRGNLSVLFSQCKADLPSYTENQDKNKESKAKTDKDEKKYNDLVNKMRLKLTHNCNNGLKFCFPSVKKCERYYYAGNVSTVCAYVQPSAGPYLETCIEIPVSEVSEKMLDTIATLTRDCGDYHLTELDKGVTIRETSGTVVLKKDHPVVKEYNNRHKRHRLKVDVTSGVDVIMKKADFDFHKDALENSWKACATKSDVREKFSFYAVPYSMNATSGSGAHKSKNVFIESGMSIPQYHSILLNPLLEKEKQTTNVENIERFITGTLEIEYKNLRDLKTQ